MKSALAIGLRGRLILLLLVAFGALTALILWQSLERRDDKLRDASTLLLNDARLIAARQQFIVAKADAILTGLALRPEVRQGADGECSQALATLLAQGTEFLNMGKVLPDGDIVCSAVPARDRINVVDRPYFRQALKTKELVVGDLVVGRFVGKPVITFAKATHDGAGRVAAVFFVSLNMEWLQQQLAAIQLPEGARLTVADARGTVAVRHPDPKGVSGKNIADLPLFRHIAAISEGTVEETGLDGVLRINGFAPLLTTVSGPLTLWLSVPKAVVEAPALDDLWRNLALALAMLLLTLGLVMVNGHRLLLGPMLRMMRTAERFGAGDLAARTGLPHDDNEIGRLARTLDEVAESIVERERKLGYANRALRVLSAGNRTLVSARGEAELLEEMCRAIVEAGGYRMGWVGYAENDKSVRLAASWGADAEFLDGLRVTWDDSASARGPTGTAIRRGIPVAANAILTDPNYAPWRERARRHGYASSLALPLRLDGVVIGALNICTTEADAFDADVIELLGEAADDLSYGIAMRRAEVEQKRTQADLQRLERQNTLILDSVGEGIFGLDLEGRATFVNPAVVAMLQWPADELVGAVMHHLHHHTRADGTPYPREACPIYAAYRDGAVHRVVDEVFWRKDGTSFPVEYVSAPLRDEHGELAGAVVSFRDITERKQALDALLESKAMLERRVAERTQQLEEASRAKSDFLANMSHELRTPLNAVIGFSEILKDGLTGELDAKQLSYVNDIFDAGTHLLSLINDILDLSKVEAGMLQLEADAVDIAVLLDASTRVVREKAAAHRIRLATDLDPSLGTLLADERKLRQIAFNLLSNAVKFTPEGGTVTLTARRSSRAEVGLDASMPGRMIPLPPGDDSEFLAITVEDNGIGIAEEHLPKLFEPFVQVDSSAARRHAGTGLGLWLVRRLVELHGGTVSVASRVGAGSRFCVWLPWREAETAAPAPQTTDA